MTVQDVIDSFREGAEKRLENEEFAKNLFQDAIRVTMEKVTIVIAEGLLMYFQKSRCSRF